MSETVRYKVVVIDDDEAAVDALEREFCQKNEFFLAGTAKNAKLGKKLLLHVRPDLLFLDVELPDMTGMELIQELRKNFNWDMKVVFYTAYNQYMIHAIRESAFDYLLKPFHHKELEEILARFMTYKVHAFTQVLPVGVGTPLVAGQPFIIFTPTNDMRALRPSEIGFFRYCSDRKQWEVQLHNQLSIPLRRGTTADQIVQYSCSFVQIHQSYIINIDYLMIIKDNYCQLYPPFDKVSELQVSKKYKKELQERFCL